MMVYVQRITQFSAFELDYCKTNDNIVSSGMFNRGGRERWTTDLQDEWAENARTQKLDQSTRDIRKRNKHKNKQLMAISVILC